MNRELHGGRCEDKGTPGVVAYRARLVESVGQGSEVGGVRRGGGGFVGDS